MRVVTPASLRELATGVRTKMPELKNWADLIEQCARELESRDAEIDGLNRALRSLSELGP